VGYLGKVHRKECCISTMDMDCREPWNWFCTRNCKLLFGFNYLNKFSLFFFFNFCVMHFPSSNLGKKWVFNIDQHFFCRVKPYLSSLLATVTMFLTKHLRALHPSGIQSRELQHTSLFCPRIQHMVNVFCMIHTFVVKTVNSKISDELSSICSNFT